MGEGSFALLSPLPLLGEGLGVRAVFRGDKDIMSLNLNRVVDRSNTGSLKYKMISRNGEYVISDEANLAHGDERMIQMWVADMDFLTAPAISEALHERIDHQIYGYTEAEEGFYDAIISWCARRYEWQIDKKWITISPGVMPALSLLVASLVKPGEKILIQPPVYGSFKEVTEANDCVVVPNLLLRDKESGRYTMDYDDLAQKAADPEVKMAILCSPHNPVGRVWSREELTRFAQICIENGVTIISDEIHCDLIYDDHQFVALASISEEIAHHTITCMAASKTFNLAGLKCSHAIISNPLFRERLENGQRRVALNRPNAFATFAVEAAYNKGEAWLSEVMAYIQANYEFMHDYLTEFLPQIKLTPPEGTYLIWADFSAFGLSQDELFSKLIDEAKVHLTNGLYFGPEGEGFIRLNIACARPTLEEGLKRIVRVFR